jgi:ABC-2 type transport system ATP-binding protein
MAGVDSAIDHGNFQDVRLAAGGDPQAFLRALVQKTEVHHFEVTRPSLHDVFVRIARPTPDELRDAGAVPA